MGGGAIYDAVRRRTTEALGSPVNLHLCVPGTATDDDLGLFVVRPRLR